MDAARQQAASSAMGRLAKSETAWDKAIKIAIDSQVSEMGNKATVAKAQMDAKTAMIGMKLNALKAGMDGVAGGASPVAYSLLKNLNPMTGAGDASGTAINTPDFCMGLDSAHSDPTVINDPKSQAAVIATFEMVVNEKLGMTLDRALAEAEVSGLGEVTGIANKVKNVKNNVLPLIGAIADAAAAEYDNIVKNDMPKALSGIKGFDMERAMREAQAIKDMFEEGGDPEDVEGLVKELYGAPTEQDPGTYGKLADALKDLEDLENKPNAPTNVREMRDQLFADPQFQAFKKANGFETDQATLKALRIAARDKSVNGQLADAGRLADAKAKLKSGEDPFVEQFGENSGVPAGSVEGTQQELDSLLNEVDPAGVDVNDPAARESLIQSVQPQGQQPEAKPSPAASAVSMSRKYRGAEPDPDTDPPINDAESSTLADYNRTGATAKGRQIAQQVLRQKKKDDLLKKYVG